MDINVDPVTPSRAFEIMACTLEVSNKLPYNIPFFIHGQPGVGKSELVQQLAEKFGMSLTVQMLTQVEATDLRGLQFINESERTTVNYKPDWLPGPDDQPTIIFLDELPSAEPRLQVAGYQLLLSGKIGQYVLAPQHYVCAAGNRVEDGAVVYEIGTALADRMQHIVVVPEPKSWLGWASKNGIHPSVMTFLQLKGHLLEQLEEQLSGGFLVGPSPRSWQRVSDILNVLGTENTEILDPMIQGWIGKSVAADFFLSLDELSGLPDPALILKMKRTDMRKHIPESLNNLWGIAFSLVAYVDSTEDFIAASEFFQEMVEHGPSSEPLGDVQKMAMEMLWEKAIATGKDTELLQHDVTQQYLKDCTSIIAIGKS